jgi:putative DNA primase/helicase
MTDAGNAEWFAAQYKDKLRFDHRRKSWLIWRKHWWVEDRDGEVYVLAKRAVRQRQKVAVNLQADSPERAKQINWAIRSESKPALEAMIGLARYERALADDGSNWDSDPWLLGVANGIVDLRTGKLRDGRPEDRITLHTPMLFDPNAQCLRFQQFLGEVFGDDEEMVRYVQRAIGYSLTGSNQEQCIFACFGEGANGKSTLLETVRFVLGDDYAHSLPFSTFELKGRASVPNDVADLVGRRFLTSAETNESVRLNEARIKALTGEDTIGARHLYGEFFNFKSTAKIWLSFNHKPVIRDSSHGMWRRVHLIPFLRRFEDGQRDPHLKEKLLAEGSGILAWAVEGAMLWQREGLTPPSSIRKATEAYREESDALADFLAEVLVLEPGATIQAAELRSEYVQWTRESGERYPLSPREFANRLEALGLKKQLHPQTRCKMWVGIRVRPQMYVTESEQQANAPNTPNGQNDKLPLEVPI